MSINGHPYEATGDDFGVRAQHVAEAHLAACMDAMFAAEEDIGNAPSSPASAPFCGCDTCVVREVLYAAWPILEEALKGAG